MMVAGTAGLLAAAAGFVSFARIGRPRYTMGVLIAPQAPSFPTHARAVMGDAVMGDPIVEALPPAPRRIHPDDTLPLHYRAIPQVRKP